MAQLTPEQFKQKLEARLRSLKIAEDIVYPVATATLDKYRQRLFGKGIDGNNEQIGTYSRKAMYAGKKQFKNTSAFRAQGKKEYIKGSKQKTVKAVSIKTRKSVNVAVSSGNRPRETMYLPNGYKELRALQGYESNFVNLQYRGDLFTDTSKLSISGETVVLKVSRVINRKKIEGLTKKYGKATFKHTAEERKFFNTEVRKRLVKFLSA